VSEQAPHSRHSLPRTFPVPYLVGFASLRTWYYYTIWENYTRRGSVDVRQGLSRRERQIVEAVYRLGEASVAEVLDELPDPPGYDSVRTTLRLLEEKEILQHRREGIRYLYSPVLDKASAREGVLRNLVRTFFDGSAHAAVLALIELEQGEVSDEEVARLRVLLNEHDAAEGGA
jgi:BlaI family penicillinase repressor